MSNPYTVLGVERNASEKEISKAYKRAALKWHPDKNTERPELAEKKFKEISDAFQLLNDPDKRAFFDRTGQRPDQQPQMRRRPQYGGAQQVYADELTPEDIFNMFFGVPPGAGRAGARRRTTGGGGGAAASAAAPLTTAAVAASPKPPPSRPRRRLAPPGPAVARRRPCGGLDSSVGVAAQAAAGSRCSSASRSWRRSSC
ncbi:hypothetical protein EMIHUDRAFT_433550 [Emiliania huxleyi CCMP1516]|uniref:J domain-containing protein n=2 Tax=Emiliania huxleyi TaxID=2903 RepID=A0A0D3KQM5_EMIH1|nr:hypothetical protein EMIHUDRAFT_433550 [Emiliania huxleyi CCMP1516]EOD38060.1 hypothetical protein EMIHUDRAFT_433550 [Emiliania huxleyi CCMP1516]|eukprot:XP_005790489.1 hypothetical protein EMIHUDRAFT_433550 [Emiliania huxleyi CCMP1516]